MVRTTWPDAFLTITSQQAGSQRQKWRPRQMRKYSESNDPSLGVSLLRPEAEL